MLKKGRVGRPKAKYSQGLRLFRIMEMLQHKHAVTISDIIGAFSIDRRTVQRDIAILKENYAIEEGEPTVANEKTFQPVSSARTEMVKISLPEMLTLFLGRSFFQFTEGTQLKYHVDSVYKKLEARLSKHDAHKSRSLQQKFYCTTGCPKNYEQQDDTSDDIITALLKERKLSITYHSPRKDPYDDVVHPYTLVLHNHALYLYCYSEAQKETRTLAVERMTQTQWIRTERFEYPEDNDPETLFASGFGIWCKGEPKKVKLVFNADRAPYVAARQWHPTMRTKFYKDGRLEITMTLTFGEEFRLWLTSYGADVKVMSPLSLREEIWERHAEAVEAE